MTRKICIVTGTRAEWGLLCPIARELSRHPDVEVQIIATNMHLDPRYGHTIDEIRAAGFEPDRCVAIHSSDPDPDPHKENALAAARCMEGMTRALSDLQPDMVVILGDRYEMIAVASAALLLGIPIAHLHGGEITLGAVDDSIRHAITKMASLHLTSTESYRQRVIQMGENPSTVINTGAIGVYNIANLPVISADELSQSIGMDIDRNTILLTYHPATLDPADPAERFGAIVEALKSMPEVKVLITYPNNDSRSAAIIEAIHRFEADCPDRVKVVPSLGMARYISALHAVGAVVGNSSSGIIEVPSAGIPTVDIGIRQQGRVAAESVIHCGDTASEIHAAIRRALSPQMQETAARCANPYYRPDTLDRIVDAIVSFRAPRFSSKTFFDIPTKPTDNGQ